MNILFVVPWYGSNFNGGVVVAVRKISEELTQRGHRIVYLVDGESDRIEPCGVDNGRPIYSVYLRAMRVGTWRIKATFGCLTYLPLTILRLRKFCRENGIDIVVICYPGIHHFYFRFLKRLFSIPYAIAVQGSDINVEAQVHWMDRWIIRGLVCQADALIANSEDMLKATKSFANPVPRRSEVIYIGIDPKWGQAPDSTGLELPPRFVFTLACPVPVKGADIVVKAFREIAGKYPDIDLVMAGTGPQEADLVQLIKDLGLSGRVIRLGEVNHAELPAVYRKAMFGIIPSRFEAFGMVSLEFQLMGKAVVASRVGGLQESITDGFNGFLVVPESPSELAAKMSTLIDNPELCRTMGRNGHQRVVASFSLNRTGERYERLLADIVTEKRR